jgi:hypothetical protein
MAEKMRIATIERTSKRYHTQEFKDCDTPKVLDRIQDPSAEPLSSTRKTESPMGLSDTVIKPYISPIRKPGERATELKKQET